MRPRCFMRIRWGKFAQRTNEMGSAHDLRRSARSITMTSWRDSTGYLLKNDFSFTNSTAHR
jgi:hypothetical protein